jgi:ATP-dependent Clp protease ATP-binding subunit ClpC
MRLEELALPEQANGDSVLAVAGIGAGVILGPEAGIHMLESTEGRASATVAVAPWEPGLRPDGEGLLEIARAALECRPPSTTIVRRYRDSPSPLVRDTVRGFRTGRLDRVLQGDFDVPNAAGIGASSASSLE